MLKKVVILVGIILLFTSSIIFSIPSGYFPIGSTYFTQSFSPSNIDPINGVSVDIVSTKLALQYTDAVILGRGGLKFTIKRTLHYGYRPGYYIYGGGWQSMFEYYNPLSPPLHAGWWQYNLPYIAVVREKFGDQLYASATYIAGDGSAKCFPLHLLYALPLSSYYGGFYDAYLDGHLSINDLVNSGSFPEKVYVMKPNGDLYIFERLPENQIDFDTEGYDGYVFRLTAITNTATDDTISFVYSNEYFERLTKIKTDADSILFYYSPDQWAVLDSIIRPDGSKLTFSDYVYQESQGWRAFTKVTDEETGLTTKFKYNGTSQWFFRPESVITYNREKICFSYTQDSLLAKKVLFDSVSNIKDSTEYSLILHKETGCNDSLIVITIRNNSDTTKYKFEEYLLGYFEEDSVTTEILKMKKTPIDSISYFWEGGGYWGMNSYGAMPALIKTVTYRFGNSYSDSFNYEQNGFMLSHSYNYPYTIYYRDPLGNISNTKYLHKLIEPIFDGNESCLPETTFYPNDSKGINVYDTYDIGDSWLTHCKLEKQYFKDSKDNSVKLAEYFYDEHGNDTTVVNALDDKTKFYYEDITVGSETFKSYHNVFSTRTTDPLLLQTYRGYDDNTGWLIKEMDSNGDITRYEYNGIGKIKKIIRPGDSSNSPTLRYTYDFNNRKKYVTIKRSSGDTTRYCYTYNTFGQLISLEEINGGTEYYYYDSFGALVKKVDPEDRTIYYRYYDNTRLLKAIVLPDSTPLDTTDNPLVKYSYSSENYQLPLHPGTYIFVDKKLVTEPVGNKTMYITDALGQLRETREYISSGQHNAGDGNGNYERVLYDYDSMGNMIKVRDERGLDKDYTYDDRNRVKQADDPDRGERINVYDDLNRLRFSQSSKDTADNRWIIYKYDKLSRLVEIGTQTDIDTTKKNDPGYPILPSKRYIQRHYDEKITSPYWAPPSGFYSSDPNLKGRLSATYYDNDGVYGNIDAVECYEYDDRGRLVHKGVRLIVDGSPEWYEIRYEYDSADNLTAIIYPDGSKVAYDYNNKNLHSEVSNGYNITYNTFAYDASGLDTLECYGNNGKGIFKYNARGLLESINVKMPYEEGDELQDVFKRNYVYDKTGNLTYEKKDLTTYANYSYDDLYRLTSEGYPQENPTLLISYTYDKAGNRTSAGTTQYTVDNYSNRLLNQGGIYYYYDENGNMDSLINGMATTTLNYDYLDKVAQVNEQGGDTTKYYYDGNGLRIRKWHITYSIGPTEGYKGIDTDTGFVAEGGAVPPASIITDKYYIHSGPGMVLVADDNTPNFLTNPGFEDDTTGWKVHACGYGDNWQIDNTNSYSGSYSLKAGSYDLCPYESYYQRFDLSEINLNTPFIASVYVKSIGLPERGAQLLVQFIKDGETFLAYGSEYIAGTTPWHEVKLVVNTIPDTAQYVDVTLRRYRGSGTVWFDAVRFENGATRTPEVKYIYGGGKRIALEKDGGIYYYHPDRLGSVRLITDEDGRVLKRYNYTAFGSVLSDSGTFDNDYLYTSQAIDENDLYYMHARYYDSSIGRFTSTDPFPGYREIPSTMHPYNYCGGNPVNFIDPLGLQPTDYDYDFYWTGNNTCNLDIYSWQYQEWDGYFQSREWLIELILEAAYEQSFYAGDPLGDLGFIEPGSFENIDLNQEALDFYNKLPKGKTKPTIKQYINEAMSRKQWSITFTRVMMDLSSFPYAKGKVIDVFTGKFKGTIKDLGTAFALGIDFSFGPQPLSGENYYEVYGSFFGRYGGISFGFGQSDFFPFFDTPSSTFKTINVHLGVGIGLPLGGVHTYTE